MTTNLLIELMNQIPFQPLEIHLSDGTAITIQEPFDISAARNSPVCVVYDADNRKRTVSVRNITEVITNHSAKP
jgi:hypothetical protein